MAITTRPLVPIAMGTSDTEEGRAFHQSRLALYGRWIFLISGAFLRHSSTTRSEPGPPVWCGCSEAASA